MRRGTAVAEWPVGQLALGFNRRFTTLALFLKVDVVVLSPAGERPIEVPFGVPDTPIYLTGVLEVVDALRVCPSKDTRTLSEA